MRLTSLLLISAGLSGCAQSGNNAAVTEAHLRDASGKSVAHATLRDGVDGVTVDIEATGLAAGTYGAHVHAVGRCDPPEFTTAGSHWNPTGRQHGRDNPQGAHLGDLPNLVVDANGRGSIGFTISAASLRGAGGSALLDGDGASVVVHAAADDYRTDPSGNSGARKACGVIG